MAKRLDHVRMREIHIVVGLMLQEIASTLRQGDRVEIRNFGVFETTVRPTRIAHNPRTGEWLITPSKSFPHFKPGKRLKLAVAATGQERDRSSTGNEND